MWFAVYQVAQWWLCYQIKLIVELKHNILSVKIYKILLRMAVKNPKHSLIWVLSLLWQYQVYDYVECDNL